MAGRCILWVSITIADCNLMLYILFFYFFNESKCHMCLSFLFWRAPKEMKDSQWVETCFRSMKDCLLIWCFLLESPDNCWFISINVPTHYISGCALKPPPAELQHTHTHTNCYVSWKYEIVGPHFLAGGNPCIFNALQMRPYLRPPNLLMPENNPHRPGNNFAAITVNSWGQL